MDVPFLRIEDACGNFKYAYQPVIKPYVEKNFKPLIPAPKLSKIPVVSEGLPVAIHGRDFQVIDGNDLTVVSLLQEPVIERRSPVSRRSVGGNAPARKLSSLVTPSTSSVSLVPDAADGPEFDDDSIENPSAALSDGSAPRGVRDDRPKDRSVDFSPLRDWRGPEGLPIEQFALVVGPGEVLLPTGSLKLRGRAIAREASAAGARTARGLAGRASESLNEFPRRPFVDSFTSESDRLESNAPLDIGSEEGSVPRSDHPSLFDNRESFSSRPTVNPMPAERRVSIDESSPRIRSNLSRQQVKQTVNDRFLNFQKRPRSSLYDKDFSQRFKYSMIRKKDEAHVMILEVSKIYEALEKIDNSDAKRLYIDIGNKFADFAKNENNWESLVLFANLSIKSEVDIKALIRDDYFAAMYLMNSCIQNLKDFRDKYSRLPRLPLISRTLRSAADDEFLYVFEDALNDPEKYRVPQSEPRVDSPRNVSIQDAAVVEPDTPPTPVRRPRVQPSSESSDMIFERNVPFSPQPRLIRWRSVSIPRYITPQIFKSDDEDSDGDNATVPLDRETDQDNENSLVDGDSNSVQEFTENLPNWLVTKDDDTITDLIEDDRSPISLEDLISNMLEQREQDRDNIEDIKSRLQDMRPQNKEISRIIDDLLLRIKYCIRLLDRNQQEWERIGKDRLLQTQADSDPEIDIAIDNFLEALKNLEDYLNTWYTISLDFHQKIYDRISNYISTIELLYTSYAQRGLELPSNFSEYAQYWDNSRKVIAIHMNNYSELLTSLEEAIEDPLREYENVMFFSEKYDATVNIVNDIFQNTDDFLQRLGNVQIVIDDGSSSEVIELRPLHITIASLQLPMERSSRKVRQSKARTRTRPLRDAKLKEYNAFRG